MGSNRNASGPSRSDNRKNRSTSGSGSPPKQASTNPSSTSSPSMAPFKYNRLSLSSTKRSSSLSSNLNSAVAAKRRAAPVLGKKSVPFKIRSGGKGAVGRH